MASRGNNPAGGIFALFIVFIFVFVGSIYALGMYSEHSQAVDLNNTSSSEIYQTQQEERNVTFALWPILEILLVIGLLVGAVSIWKHY